MPTILNWKTVTPSTDFKYEKPRASGTHDGFSVKVSVKNGDNFSDFIHLGPIMTIPFGLKVKDDANSKYGPRYKCDMSFPGVKKNAQTGQYEGDPELVQYLSFLQSVDDNNKAQALAHVDQWFKKKHSAEVIDAFYFKNILPASPENEHIYSPKFNTKLQVSNGKFITEFYNQHKQEIKFDDIQAGVRVKPLIEARSLWFAANNFGMSYRIIQLMVYERDVFKGCVIDPGFAVENTDLKNTIQDKTEPTPKRAISEAFNMPEENAEKRVKA